MARHNVIILIYKKNMLNKIFNKWNSPLINLINKIDKNDGIKYILIKFWMCPEP